MSSVRDTFNALMGELDYPMFNVEVARSGPGVWSGSRRSAASTRRASW
jgi:hypothetical protein